MSYPHERQVEYWTSRAIEEYFDNEGYTVVVLPNSPHIEKRIPYDHLFAGQKIKVFGLQYKRLYPGNPDYWLIDIPQWQRAKRFPWIYYALSQIVSIRQRRNALHLLTIVESHALGPQIASSAAKHAMRLKDADLGKNKILYFRWGGFVRALFGCRVGWSPASIDELRGNLADAKSLLSTLADLYIVPFQPGIVVKVSSSWRPLEDEGRFDFGLDENNGWA